MPNTADVKYRYAAPSDASRIAAIHAASWRRHYRGDYSDSFLDHDVVPDRLAVWTERMRNKPPNECTLVAESEGEMIGFCHTILDHNPTWGALLENLHVVSTWKRRSVGRQLMARLADLVLERTPAQGLYLWVLQQNAAAQAFYAANGGRRAERDMVTPPGGITDRLNGKPSKLRYVWTDLAALSVLSTARSRSLPPTSR